MLFVFSSDGWDSRSKIVSVGSLLQSGEHWDGGVWLCATLFNVFLLPFYYFDVIACYYTFLLQEPCRNVQKGVFF